MNTANQTCLIVGASHAGVNAAFSLRRQGWAGKIVLFDRDPELPYHRPPLSKGFLSGETTVEDSLLKGAASYEKENIELRLGISVIRIDSQQKRLVLADKTTVSYDRLLLATGASALLPPIPGLRDNPGVFALRTAADARKIRHAFGQTDGKKVVVIGGGYIGLEAAASLAKLGGDVTVLERENRVLARVTSPEMSAFFTDLHTSKGVKIDTGRSVVAIEDEAGRQRVVCADDTAYPADLIIVGVGVSVNTQLAEAAGLTVAGGIVVDGQMRTSASAIYAVGDCTVFPHPRYGREMRLESVQNAVDQAKVATASICGQEAEYDSLPWFWSDQFGIKLQMCGLSTGYDQLVIRHERSDDPHRRSFWYFRDGRLLSVDAINHGRAYMLGMKLLKSGQHPDPVRLADPAVELHPRTILVK